MPAVGFNRLRLQHMNGAAALLVVNQAPQLIDAAVAERVVRFSPRSRINRLWRSSRSNPRCSASSAAS
jgi:hypothetical protein